MRDHLYAFLPLLILFLFSCSPESVEVIDTTELRNRLDLPITENKFELPLAKDTLLRTAKGLGLYIEKDAFVDGYGQRVEGNIQLSVREVLTGSELFRENISTTTVDGKILATRGMLDIKAFAGGKELQLAPGKTIELFFPGDSTLYTGAKIFYGKENEEGIVEWEAESDTISSLDPINWDKQIDLAIFYSYENHLDIVPDKGFFAEVPAAIDSLLKWMDLSKAEEEALINKSVTVYWILFKDGDFEVYAIDGDLRQSAKDLLTRKLNDIPSVPAFYREGDKASIEGFFQMYFHEKENKLFNGFRLSANRLGWVNCDIFYDIDKPLTDMIIHAPSDSVLMKLVFKEYKTMVSGVLKEDGNVHFYNLPLGEPVQVIAVYPQHTEILFSITHTTVTTELPDLAPSSVVSKTELEGKLNKLF
jgi:hypothetical protein